MIRSVFKWLIPFFIAAVICVFAVFIGLNSFLAPVVEKKIRQFAAKNFDGHIQIAEVRLRFPEAIVRIKGFKLNEYCFGKSRISIDAGESTMRLSLVSVILQKKLFFDEVQLKNWVLVIEKNALSLTADYPLSGAITISAPSDVNTFKSFFPVISARMIKVENLKLIFKDSGNIEPCARMELCAIGGTISNFSASLEDCENFEGRLSFKGYFDSRAKGLFKATAFIVNKCGRVNLAVRSEIKDADLTYFSQYYTNTSFAIIRGARIDLASNARCVNNELRTSHKAHIYDIELNKVIPRPDDTLFGLPAVTVVNFFNDYGGEVKFGFNVNGPLDDLKFEPGPLVQKVLSKALGDRIAARLKELPRDVAKISEMAIKGDIDIGKESQAWFGEIEKRFEGFTKDLSEKHNVDKKNPDGI